jgi:regulator-associated protein of mTOR
MKPNEPDEPGSSDYNQRLWRGLGLGDDLFVAAASPEALVVVGATGLIRLVGFHLGKAGASRWDNSVALLSNGSQPHKMCFHQFEDHIAQILYETDG